MHLMEGRNLDLAHIRLTGANGSLCPPITRRALSGAGLSFEKPTPLITLLVHCWWQPFSLITDWLMAVPEAVP